MTNKQRQHPAVQAIQSKIDAKKLTNAKLSDIIARINDNKRYWLGTPMPTEQQRAIAGSNRWGMPTRSRFVPRDKRWSQLERDAKRVQGDPKFRKNATAKLKRAYARLWTCPDSEFLTTLAAYQIRQSALKLGTPVQPQLILIDEHIATGAGYTPDRRGKDWSVNATLKESYRVYRSGQTKWSGGHPKSYTRATNDTFVRSFAVASPTIARGVAHLTLYSVTAPQGTAWETDQNLGGVKLVLTDSRQDDYHPTAADMLAGPETCLRKLLANQVTRRNLAAQHAAEAAELEGVFVGMRDSLRAGNCAGGSAAFCDHHQLDPHKHYGAVELLKIANGDASRVRLAIKAATIRHRADMLRGYTEIEYYHGRAV